MVKRFVDNRNKFIIEEFKEYFGKFGKVEDFERINDVVTGEFKGDSFDFRRDLI